MIASELSSSRRREKIWPSLTTTIFSTCSLGSTVSPLTVTEDTLYWSPSLTPAADEHVLPVGADRDLGGVDVEVDVAAIEVVVVELFQVARELLARVLVVATVPAEPVVLGRFPGVDDVLVLELLVAHQIDVLDARGLAFLDRDLDVDAVAVQARDGRCDLGVVLAAVLVLAGQLLAHLVEDQAVEGVTFGHAVFLEALHQVFGLDVLVAGDLELVDRRALLHGDDKDAALAIQTDVLEEASLVERADRCSGLGRIDGVAAFDRQIGEDGAGRDALQAIDADVGDGESFR